MLTRKFSMRKRAIVRARQSGVVLVIALIVLVAMTMAALGLVRSVDTNNLIAGNMAFQQAAVREGDVGVEAALTWLGTQNLGQALYANDPSNGYKADGSAPANNPLPGQTWAAFWNASLASRARTLSTDANTGNTVSYVVDRMCNNIGAKYGGTASCVASPSVSASDGNSEEANEIQLNSQSLVYYRITVRIDGPKNTVSYVQAMVSL